MTVLGALAILHAERGEIVAAEQLFDQSRVATVVSRRSHWRCWISSEASCGWRRATSTELSPGSRPRFVACQPMRRRRAIWPKSRPRWANPRQRSPGCFRSRRHPTTPITRRLARILGDAGRAEEAAEWRNRTAARYDELMARHPEAFADHAAEFWLDAGDAGRARRLAQMNLQVRQTPRAHELLARAAAFGALAPYAQSTLDLRRPRRKWGRTPEERVMTDKATNEARAPRKGLRSGASQNTPSSER